MATAGGIILLAGTLTTGNIWLQQHKIAWRVPVATLAGVGIFNLMSKLSDRFANGLAGIVLIGAMFSAPQGGTTVASEFAKIFQATGKSGP